MSAELDRLCTRCGVELEYWDLWGNRRYASDSTKLRLLQAMGVPIDAAENAGAALAALEQAAWREALAPVKVARAGAPVDRRSSVPAARAASKYGWILELESGERTAGTLQPDALPVLARAEIEGEALVRASFRLTLPLPRGYHRYTLLEEGKPAATTQIIVCPGRCYEPPVLADGGRVWGPAVQLYALRSQRNWGIGDFSDLQSLAAFAAGAGAGLVGVNPLHALFPDQPEDASPYRPASRSRLNVLYLDVAAVPDFRECAAARDLVAAPEFQSRLQALREAALVDYTGVAAAKFQALELMYRSFRERHLAQDSHRARAFRAFQAEGGEPLRLHALFDALQQHFSRNDAAVWGWPAWPEAYRDSRSAAVAAFARENGERVDYFLYLQWQADLQLGQVARRLCELNVPLGLFQDLAVGVNPGGSETWIEPGRYALSARIGCPPDDFNLKGQEWGLPPWIPQRLAAAAYGPYVATLRELMRHAGVLRLDHVMGLMRLFWVPEGASAEEGAYVNYPFADLLGILALESERNQCLVIGEDLGTVPDGLRAAMAEYGLLAYRTMYFEKTCQGEFKPPARVQPRRRGRRHYPRPADARRLLAGRRPGDALGARSLSVAATARPAVRGARQRSRPAARRSGARGTPARGHVCGQCGRAGHERRARAGGPRLRRARALEDPDGPARGPARADRAGQHPRHEPKRSIPTGGASCRPGWKSSRSTSAPGRCSRFCARSAASDPEHQPQLERMGQQLVAGIDPDAVVQPAAQLGLQLENETVLARAGDRARSPRARDRPCVSAGSCSPRVSSSSTTTSPGSSPFRLTATSTECCRRTGCGAAGCPGAAR